MTNGYYYWKRREKRRVPEEKLFCILVISIDDQWLKRCVNTVWYYDTWWYGIIGVYSILYYEEMIHWYCIESIVSVMREGEYIWMMIMTVWRLTIPREMTIMMTSIIEVRETRLCVCRAVYHIISIIISIIEETMKRVTVWRRESWKLYERKRINVSKCVSLCNGEEKWYMKKEGIYGVREICEKKKACVI